MQLQELDMQLFLMEKSSRDLVTYLREEGHDDVVSEAEVLAKEIEDIRENMVLVDGVVNDDTQQKLVKLTEKLGTLAQKVNGCQDEEELAAFEEGFQVLKARREMEAILH